jgi:competence protein ComGC
MPATSIPQLVAKMQIGGADKKALTNLLQAQADDIELLRGTVNAVLAKLDAGGATVAALGTTNVATLAVTPAKLNLRK